MAEKTQPARKIAVLDEKGVLTGYRAKKAKDRTKANEIDVPGDCDLAPGLYKWTGSCFLPLTGGHGKPAGEPVPMAAALYGALVAMRDGGPPSEKTIAWMDWYANTMDGRG